MKPMLAVMASCLLIFLYVLTIQGNEELWKWLIVTVVVVPWVWLAVRG